MALPQPNGEFEWVQAPWGAALRCPPLSAVAPHWFSTRQLSLQGVRGEDRAGWDELARALGVAPDALVRLRQVHGAGIWEPRRGLHTRRLFQGEEEWPEADIAIAGDPAVALSVRAADCVPVLLADRRRGAVAAVHAGWKGTAIGAVIAAVQALHRRFETEPADVIAAIGPSIGPCCYEVGPELRPRFSAHPDAPRWFSHDPKPRLDLWRATRDQLERAGVPAPHIHACELCTSDHPQLFHSYRRDGARAGRLVAAIRSAPDRTL